VDGVDGPALAGADEVDPAVAVWIAANPARADGQHARNLRAWARLAGARLSILRKGDRIVAMALALALPGRANGGAGDLVPGLVHLTGVCVHPDQQRHGLGREVLGLPWLGPGPMGTGGLACGRTRRTRRPCGSSRRPGSHPPATPTSTSTGNR
jgi:GNAT superfamily N-acetyltransferase